MKDLTQSNSSTIYKTLGGSNTICLSGKNVPGNLILRTLHRSKHSLALFPSPSLVLQLKGKHHSIKWQSGELVREVG